MNQEVKTLPLKDLVLWTENPRDPINPNASNQEIVDNAINNRRGKWKLSKLAKEMGAIYDYSELPIVVYSNNKPVVYDGNRRVILGLIQHGYVNLPQGFHIDTPDIPVDIPCNVCSEKIALDHVLRKHGDSGSWDPLERDIFLHKFMGAEKSLFLFLEDETGIITANPHLNKRFVKEEIFKEETLRDMGFLRGKNGLKSIHNQADALSILNDVSNKIKQKVISTRENRGNTIQVLDPSSRQLINQNKNKKLLYAK